MDESLPEVIASLKERGVRVYGLTSRGRDPLSYTFAWHNAKVVEALAQNGVEFSPLPQDQLTHGDNTEAGGIIYAGGDELTDKAVLMQRVTDGDAATLVDNSEHKLVRATSLGRACVPYEPFELSSRGVCRQGSQDGVAVDVPTVHFRSGYYLGPRDRPDECGVTFVDQREGRCSHPGTYSGVLSDGCFPV